MSTEITGAPSPRPVTRSVPGRHARPRRRLLRWYLLPAPLAVLAVLVMPWAVVRDARQLESSFRTLCHVFMRQAARLEQYEQPPRERHLYLVK